MSKNSRPYGENLELVEIVFFLLVRHHLMVVYWWLFNSNEAMPVGEKKYCNIDLVTFSFDHPNEMRWQKTDRYVSLMYFCVRNNLILYICIKYIIKYDCVLHSLRFS